MNKGVCLSVRLCNYILLPPFFYFWKDKSLFSSGISRCLDTTKFSSPCCPGVPSGETVDTNLLSDVARLEPVALPTQTVNKSRNGLHIYGELSIPL